MGTKHTPGPWNLESYYSSGEQYIGAEVDGVPARIVTVHYDDGVTMKEAAANAKLIYSAPRLKDALWSLIGTLPTGTQGGEFFEAMNALRQAEGLPEFVSFDAAMEHARATYQPK